MARTSDCPVDPVRALAESLWRALGLTSTGLTSTADDLLSAIPGATSREQDIASHLANVLWESTLGSYLTDFLSPLFTDAAAAQVRDHVRRHLVPAGPFPSIRIGRQPYGILPVVAPRRFSAPADARFETELFGWLGRLRPFWEAGVGRAPRLGRTASLDADLTQLLQTTPLASTFRFRSVIGPLAVNATSGLKQHAWAQEQVTQLLGAHLRWPRRPDLAGFAVHPADHPLRVPLVDPKPIVPGARLSSNYLQEIADLTRTSGSYDAIKAREDARTLLEALVAHATARELHRADIRTIDKHRLATGLITALPDVSPMPASEYVGIEPVVPPLAAAGVLIASPAQASRVVIPSITGSGTVRQFVTAAVKRGAPVPADYRTLGDMLASIEWLAVRPADQLDRALRGLLDVYAYRIDAWYTSLATRRLASLRAATPVGVHLGGYGWIDDLRPGSGGTSQGFVHAPSIPQAATAAVLRSGHLAHNDAEHKALDLDLSSARVRTALRILDGIAEGQPLAALLGYRFERAVRTRSLTLAMYILPIRRLAPLRPSGAAPASASASETIAARDVVDGVALLDRWRAERATLLGALVPAPPPADRDALAAELDRLADVYDAVADVMVAEAVHQNVLGNNERAGAVLAALDRQERPPRMDFVRTPRTGKSFTHRLLVLIGDESLPASWGAIPPDARARAEPRLNAWIARLIGDPKRVRFAATASGGAQQLTLSLDQLRLSPLSLVMATEAAGRDAPSELEERLIHLLAAKLTAPAADTELVLLDAPPDGSNAKAIGLGAFRALMRSVYRLISTHRPATATDLALPQDATDEGLDHAQLGARAAANAGALRDSLADRATLCAGDDLAPMAWLQRMALVRGGADRLARVLSAAELLESGVAPTDLVLAQLPRASGERWLALPFAGTVPEAELAIVAHWSGAVSFATPLAGLFCDAWPEIVPSREETTGIAFLGGGRDHPRRRRVCRRHARLVRGERGGRDVRHRGHFRRARAGDAAAPSHAPFAGGISGQAGRPVLGVRGCERALRRHRGGTD